MGYKGFYKVRNYKKYRGDPTQCIFRSLWERKFMKFCDFNENVLEWSSEEVKIPYRSPLDGRIHFYFVDFWMSALGKNGQINHYLVEIKPRSQTVPPTPRKSRSAYFNEVKTYVVNERKWDSARRYCEDRGWKFVILTEDHLFGRKK